ncbi:MAG: O-antigen ligase family protein, partial [Mycobacteriales bacterium]
LVAAVPVRDWVADNALPRLVLLTAPAALIIMITGTFGVAVDLPIPLAPVYGFGALGADAATLFAALGLIGLGLELARPIRRAPRLAAAIVLAASPLASSQRAALLGLGAATLVLFLFAAVHGSVGYVRLRSGDVALGVLVVGGLAGLAVVLMGMRSSVVRDFVDEQLRSTFQSTAKAQSAQSRINQWRAARELIAQQPLFGSGLGTEFVHYEVGPNEFWTQNITHNIGLDLLMRTGLLGFTLFTLALLSSLAEGVRAVWRSHSPQLVALSALAIAAIVAFLAKGTVESVLEKYRLCVLVGLALGWMYRCWTETASAPGSGFGSAALPHRQRALAGVMK